MKRTAFPVAAAAFLLVAAKAPEERRISYRMTPLAEAEGNALLVDLRFRGDSDGETILHLPTEWSGSRDLWRHIEFVDVRGPTRITGPYQAMVLHHRPGARIRARYKVRSAYSGEPGFAYEKARPIVSDDFFFFHGESVFAVPGDRQAAPARFRWGKIPQGWRIASDLDHLRRQPSTLANMVQSVAIGGSGVSVVERRIGDAPFRLALAGKWSFEPAALADTLAAIVAASNAYWGDVDRPFMVAMAPLGDGIGGVSTHGTGRTDAFSIASTAGFELAQAKRFLGHEYMHGWLPNALGHMPQPFESADYWFSEGFSDYLAGKILLRTGLWSLSDYVADKNATLLRYGLSPAKAVKATDIRERVWTDPDIQQLSYDRGHLIAVKLDADIAARTGGRLSLDDVLRAQLEPGKNSAELATALFRKTLLDKTGIDATPELERHAVQGESILLPEDLLGDCARLVTKRRKSFDRGFDLQATRRAEGEIAGVDPKGPAYAAGLRDGMFIVDRQSGVTGDSTVELAYRVLDDTRLRIIRYLPAGRTEHDIQRMVLTAEGPEAQARCKARLGGAP